MRQLGPIVALPENRVARQALRRAASAMRRGSVPVSLLPLMLHGPPGVGKSHLLGRFVQSLLARCADLTVEIVPANELTFAPDADQPADRHAWQTVDLLIVEDLQHLAAGSIEQLTHLLDYRRAARRLSIITANAGPAQLHGLSQRLRSRLAQGLIVPLEPPGLASRQRLIRRLAARRRLALPDAVVDWLAGRYASSVRALLGALGQLAHLPPEPTLASVQAHLEQAHEPPRPLLESLTRAVADHFGVSVKHLCGPSRQPHLLWPRQVCMYLAHRHGQLPLARIGQGLGQRTHTTVLHAIRKVEQSLRQDSQLASQLARIWARVGGCVGGCVG